MGLGMSAFGDVEDTENVEETGVTYKCDLCNFSSNRKNELGLHISNKHAKFSEIEIEESCLENVAEDQESIAVATPADDDEKDAVKQPRRLWYYCCDHGCIAEHHGLMSNGSLFNIPECPCCKDECQVHTFATIGSEVVEYEPP